MHSEGRRKRKETVYCEPNLAVLPDVEDDELDESLGVHEEAKSEGLANGDLGDEGRDDCAGNLSKAGVGDDEDEEAPGAGAADRGDVGLETAGDEVEREKEAGNKVLHFLDDHRREGPVLRHDDTHHEGAE